ncbi:uncharacterized protein LOC125053360 isoform X1 [Pieris napi]|uniref:uncharacterized protein LOC125053360 isoform X1 n=1 Tax=Pieris napi TaxID=78633 RepID=UPI001FB8A84B|nr:uncharacterized protein LOC125053360 isoform X1 [Pieris napi]
MKCELIFVIVSAVMRCVICTHYDQSQSGDFNVQVGLKDLQIIALLNGGKEEYVDYDYAYDYNEMTIKPQNRTTPRPLNASTSTEPDSVRNNKTTVPALHDQTEPPTRAPITGLYEPSTDVTVIDNNTTTKNAIEASSETSLNTIASPNSTSNGKKCKKGFVLNYKGDCELKLQSTGNALLKLVKLSQKLKLRRENKED